MTYNKNPMGIETESFQIIGDERPDLFEGLDNDTIAVLKRVIHTTADYEYGTLVEFHPDAIAAGKKALINGFDIYADTSMIQTGVQRRRLKELNVTIKNYVHDDDVYEMAEKENITRSMAGIKKAITDEAIKIFAIGNAPTAIFQLKELIEDGYPKPDLIIGVPVGFVGAEESKALLSELDVPFIRVNGRKGGSTVAVAIINGIMKTL